MFQRVLIGGFLAILAVTAVSGQSFVHLRA